MNKRGKMFYFDLSRMKELQVQDGNKSIIKEEKYFIYFDLSRMKGLQVQNGKGQFYLFWSIRNEEIANSEWKRSKSIINKRGKIFYLFWFIKKGLQVQNEKGARSK